MREGQEQFDQIGRFLTKVAQMIGNFLGNFEKSHSYLKTAVATSWVTFGNIWATFTQASGHTGQELTSWNAWSTLRGGSLADVSM